MSAWIIRADKGGVRAPEWINGGYIAIYWNLNGADISALSKDDIKTLYRAQFPDASRHKGITDGSLGTYETSPAWRKRQKKKAERYEEYCKRKSGPVKTTRTGSPEKRENISRGTATNQKHAEGAANGSK